MSEVPSEKFLAMGNKEKVAKIINSVLEKVSKAEEISREAIFHELLDVQSIIEDMRKQVGMSGVGDINGSHIPGATDELDAVVASTAGATGTIMDACDVIMEKSGEAGAAGAVIMDQVTKIYEACSFQDITGQRITKVIRTLKEIEEKIDTLVSSISDKMPLSLQKAQADEKTFEQSLLNGPQMPDQAISQADIDKLLEDFD